MGDARNHVVVGSLCLGGLVGVLVQGATQQDPS